MSNAYQQPSAARPLYRMKRVWAGGLLLLMIGTGCGALGSEDTSKPTKAAPAPAVTVTTTATATVTATPSAAPAPTVTATRTVTATATVTRQAPAAADDSSDAAADTDTDTDTDTDSGSVYYANCTAARAAGAAPVHRGEPGYASHLDRDNDGVGCDNG
ncbi:excalibur calcium-binding domain-containing protein [Streptomyces lavendulocolor]|uniref:excalibur calcium-binding domain-containing protein n=1 Tax=Streptomyces lavendulocolor TaxID=67316 RepID=UPI003C2FCA9C